MSVGVVVPGATGRMGRLLAGAAIDDTRHVLLGATARPGTSTVGRDVGELVGRGAIGVPFRASLHEALSSMTSEERARACVIDFTLAELCASHAEAAAEHGVPLVVGTTGLCDDAGRALDEAARRVPVLQAANTSLGANLLMALTGQATRALPDADVEIVELHHKGKRDAPSGTALRLGEEVASARGKALSDLVRLERAGVAPRQAGEVGIFGVRGGDVPGEHTVYFLLDGERMELVHRVTDRRIFALGALAAARFLVGKAPGRYTMRDVLGL